MSPVGKNDGDDDDDDSAYFCSLLYVFSETLCPFLQFSPLESCYIWFVISLEYSSAYVCSCCPGKIQNQGLSGGTRCT